MNKAIIVARYELKQWIGSLRFWGVIGFLVFLIVGQLSGFMPVRLPGMNHKFHLVLEMMSGIGVIIPIFLSYDTLSKEADQNTLQAVLTKPISRASLFLGKWLFTIVYALIVITIPVAIGAIWTSVSFTELVTGIGFGALGAIAFLSWTLAASGLALKKGSGTVAALTIIGFVGLFSLGMSSEPAISRFSPTHLTSLYGMTFEGIPLQAGDLYFGLVYAACLIVFLLSVGVWSFSRQDI
ncbi:MAG: ABC transporter permease subunit [Chloroflexota bacterium]